MLSLVTILWPCYNTELVLSGGAVAQVLVLKSYGVPISKGTPIVLIRTVFSIMFLVIMLPLVFLRDAIEIPYISEICCCCLRCLPL